MIDSISMGKLLFDGQVSRSDTIVYKDRINTKWWIKAGNRIELADLDEALAAEPEVLVFGLGFMIPVTLGDQVVPELKHRGIEVFVGPSEEAAEVFNKKAARQRTVGLFHLL
jgi:hypothetical protein